MEKTYKMIALDMDGTLLNSEKQITPLTKAAIKKAHAQGVKIVLATGRPLEGIYPALKELDLLGSGNYALSFNGALVVNVQEKRPIYANALKGSDYKKLNELSCQLGVNCHAFSTRQGLIARKNSRYTQVEVDINKIPLHIVNPSTDINDDEDIIKVMFIDEPAILEPALKKLPDWAKNDYNSFRSTPSFFEFMHKHVDKGAGLSHLAQYLNISRDEIIACGDEGNDAAMIKYAGLGVAMGNAIDSIKAIADYVTDTNDDDGIAKVIDKFIFHK